MTTKEQKKAWKDRNKDKVKAANEKWRAKNPDYLDDWRAANADKVKAYAHKYYLKSIEKESGHDRYMAKKRRACGC